MGNKIWKDIKWLKKKAGFSNVEFKRHDIEFSGATVNPLATADLGHLTSIAQGDTTLLRDGNSIKATGFDYRLTITMPATPENQIVRFILVKSNYGETVPQIGNILSDATDIHSYRNIDSSRGYNVLVDKFFTMDVLKNEMARNVKHLYLSNHLKYSGAAGSTFTFGQLWFMIASDATTNFATYELDCRLRFVDN